MTIIENSFFVFFLSRFTTARSPHRHCRQCHRRGRNAPPHATIPIRCPSACPPILTRRRRLSHLYPLPAVSVSPCVLTSTAADRVSLTHVPSTSCASPAAFNF